MRTPYTRVAAIAIAGTLALGAASQADAITIIRNFIAPGNSFPGGGTAGSNGSNQAGGGTLQGVVNAAADYWEAALLDTHTVTINYGWQSLSGGTLGVHNLLSQGGSPNRETSARLRFDNDAGTPWFTDLTPYDSSEYSTFTEYSANLGGGTMNVGREHTGATGSAVGRYDLFAVALHEVGHALGMSSANSSFQSENGDGDIDITSPLPYTGASIPTISGAHLNFSHANLRPSVSAGVRRDLSEIDILANAQISQFNNVNLNPVPEPASMIALGLGAVAFVSRRRRKKA